MYLESDDRQIRQKSFSWSHLDGIYRFKTDVVKKCGKNDVLVLKIKDILSVVEKVGRRLIRNDVFIFHLCLEFTNFIWN